MKKTFINSAIIPLIFAFSSMSAADELIANESIGDWDVFCDTVHTGKCIANQTIWLVNGDAKQKVISSSISKEEQNWQMTLTLPMGVYLPFGAVLKVDQGEEFKTAFHSCDTAGCKVFIEMGSDFLSALRKGNNLTVGFKASTSNKLMALNLSLKGFTRASNKVSDN